MWAHVADWMVLEGVVPDLRPGAVLSSAGVRVLGEVVSIETPESDGITQARTDETDPSRSVYQVTGVATDVRGVEIDTGRGRQPGGTEFVLTIGSLGLQVRLEQTVPIETGSRATVTGRMVVVGDYEWEAFRLTDTRTDWHVRSVVSLSDGDFMLDLTPAVGG